MQDRPTTTHTEKVARGAPSSLRGGDLPPGLVTTRPQPSDLDDPESVRGLDFNPAHSFKDGLL